MKKFLTLALIAFVGLSAHATTITNGMGPSVGSEGGTVNGGAAIQFGVNPGAQAGAALPLFAKVTITKGDALVLVAGRGCSKTTTVCDTAFIGFAADDTAYNAICTVLRAGVVAARIGTSTTVNDALVMSANPGFLTPSAACSGAVFTQVSLTAVAARAFITQTYSASAPTVLVVR